MCVHALWQGTWVCSVLLLKSFVWQCGLVTSRASAQGFVYCLIRACFDLAVLPVTHHTVATPKAFNFKLSPQHADVLKVQQGIEAAFLALMWQPW